MMIHKAKKAVGQTIDYSKLKPELADKIKDRKLFIYFWAPHCGKCKHQKPAIENLVAEKTSIIEINIEEDRETASAFGLMGTPTTVLVNNNLILDIFVGVRSEAFLRNKFKSVD